MNLGKIQSAVEHDDHFAVDDGTGKPFRVAKAGLSPALQDRVRQLYCGGRVKGFAAGGVVDDPVEPMAVEVPATMVEPMSEPITIEGETTARTPEQLETAAPVAEPAVVPVVVAPAAPVAGPAPTLQAPIAPAPVVAAAPAATTALTPAAPAAAAPAAPASPAPPVLTRIPPAPTLAEILGRAVGGEGPPTEIETAVGRAAEAKAATLKATADLAQTKLRTETEAAADLAAQAKEAETQVVALKRIADERKAALDVAQQSQKQKQEALLNADTALAETQALLSPGQRIGLALSSIAMAVGYAMSGRTDGAEMAQKTVNDSVDRMVAQQRTLKEGQRAARLRDYQLATGETESATRLYEADLKDLMAAKAKESSLKLTSASARRALETLASQLTLGAQQSREEAINYVAGMRTQLATQARAATREELGIKAAEQGMLLAESADARAERQLRLQQAQLAEARTARVESRQAAQAQATAAQTVDDIRRAGLMGAELNPRQFSVLPRDETPAYVPVISDDGALVYRRAMSTKDAETIRDVREGKEIALQELSELESLIKQGTGAFGEDRQRRTRAEAIAQGVLTTSKNILRLGALTAADIALLQPMLPAIGDLTTLDSTNLARIAELRRTFSLMESKALKNKLTVPAESPAPAAVASVGAAAAAPVPAEPASVAPQEAPRVLGYDARGQPVLSNAARPEIPGLGSLIGSMIPDPELSMLRRQAQNPQLTERQRQRYRDQVAELERKKGGS